MFKVIIAGSRSFNNYNFLKETCNRLLINKLPEVTIISGTAKGADSLGERYAQEKGLKVDLYPADWDFYGKSAGFKRNIQMAEQADALIAFWDSKSHGTKHMIDIAERYKLLVKVIHY